MTTPVLYHCPQTRSGSALWMNEELGAPCKIELIDVRAGSQKTGAYLKINPMGKVPTLSIGDVNVTEVAAICAFLADQYPDAGLAPAPNALERGAYYRWMFFAPSCIEPTMLDVFEKRTRGGTASAGHGGFDDVIASIRAAIAPGPYILGERFSAADVVFGSTLRFATMFGAIDREAEIDAYLNRLEARPAFIACQEKDAAYASDLGWS